MLYVGCKISSRIAPPEDIHQSVGALLLILTNKRANFTAGGAERQRMRLGSREPEIKYLRQTSRRIRTAPM